MNSTFDTAPAIPGLTIPRARPSLAQRAGRALSFRNIGAVYVWVAIVIVFAIWIPSTFLTWTTAKQILNGNASTALMALALIVPLCTRTFDLSVGFVASLGCVTSAYMIGHGMPVSAAVAIAVGGALFVGLVNGFVVVGMGVDSFIATLATGSLIQSFITLMTNQVAITDPKLTGPFAHIGQTSVAGLTLPVLYVVALASGIWFVLEHTATGRRLYATGFNVESARLAGVKTKRLRFISLVVSAVIAGFAGVVLASTLGSGDPQAGSPYLLSAYAAAFLGASQLRPGRFNAWGALIAVLLLGTGTTGLGLAGAANWTVDMFTGVVLIAALAITGAERRALRKGWRQRLSRGGSAEADVQTTTNSPNGRPALAGADTQTNRRSA
jgi:ribose/xylose/arabinose/galactoside ABC-type transport system permease subunit